MNLDILSVFIIVSIAQGLFVMFMLWRMESTSKYSNLFLALVIACFTWYLLEFLFIKKKIDVGFYLMYGTRYGAWLLLGPLLWLYLKSYFDSGFRPGRWNLTHFLPFVIITVLIPLFSDKLLTWRSVDYGMLTVFDNWNRDPISIPQYIYGSIFIVQFLHVAAYVWFGFLFLNAVESGLKNEYSNFNPVNIKWHKVFLLLTIGIIAFTSSYIIFQFLTEQYVRNADYFYVIPMAGAIYILLYHAIKFPNLIFKYNLSDGVEKYQKSSLAANVSQVYLQQLQDLIEKEKLYLNRELRLKDLADELGISTHHLSQAINENLNKNFFELINEYRVEAAKNKITNEAEKSILQVAFEVGFNNKVSFNNAFKKYVGMTPTRYRQSA